MFSTVLKIEFDAKNGDEYRTRIKHLCEDAASYRGTNCHEYWGQSNKRLGGYPTEIIPPPDRGFLHLTFENHIYAAGYCVDHMEISWVRSLKVEITYKEEK
jgi:hypothetical protein